METAETLDALAQEYLELVASAEVASDKVAALRHLLIERVQKDGSHPPRATKTKMLAGEIYELRVSQPTEVTVDTKMAMRIREACARAGARGLFARMFRKVETFVLAGETQKLMNAPLPAKAPRNLRGLFARAVQTRELSPSLEVKRREKKEAAA